MVTLHILRSAPDGTTRQILDRICNEGQHDLIKLYEQDVDWEGVVEAIFNSGHVVCWW